MEKKKRLLFISTRAFWKMDGGHQYEIFHYLRGLHEHYGYEVYVYTFVDDDKADNRSGIPEYVKEVRFAKKVSVKNIIINAITHGFSKENPWPLQLMLFYSKDNSEQIKAFVEEINPEAIYVDMVRLAPYISAFKDKECLKVLGYDDLLSERYKRQIDASGQSANFAGAYSDKMPSFISRLQKINVIKKVVLNTEATRMERAELYYANHYDSGIFVSPIETRKFNKKIGREMAYTVAMGIDYAYQAEEIEVEYKGPSLSYVGNMKTAANYETVVAIIEKVLPHVKKEYTLYIIGTAPDELRKKYESKSVVFTGRVDDLRKYVKATDVFLSPIAFGTGIKTKILEAFAMGMPVITNSIGVEGIEVENGYHCFVEDEYEMIADAVDRLLDDRNLREKLKKNAQELARTSYQWEENFKSFAQVGF